MPKTAVVLVQRIKEHKKYKRRYKVQKKYKADTGEKNYNIGDIVLIEECRPISKEKKWKIINKLAESRMVDLAEPVDSGAEENIEQK